jgi:molecular chaperone DnaK
MIADAPALDAGIKSEVEAAVASAKEALMSRDADKMKAAAQTLGEVVQKHQAAFTVQGNGPEAGGEAPAGEGQTKSDEKVVDAEFTEIKDDKK